jgi:archaemetzincin
MTDERQPDDLERIEVLEVAAPPRDLVEAVAAALSRRVSVPCSIRSAPAGFAVPRIRGRNQADADRLLAAVEALDPPEGHVLVALTAEDIGHPIFTHFFGRARHFGAAAVVSVARLDPQFYGLPADRGATVRRTVLEIVHELGHLAGLEHCDDWGCIMRFASTVEAIDNRGSRFCLDCAAELPPAFEPSHAR